GPVARANLHRQTRERIGSRLAVLDRVRRVHQVRLELRLKRRKPLPDHARTLAIPAVERDAAEAEIPQCLRDELALDRAVGRQGPLELEKARVQRLVLTELRVELGD